MKITLNGQPHETQENTKIGELVESLELGGRRVAVMLNEHVIKRDQWTSVVLADGDIVEVVQMVGGG